MFICHLKKQVIYGFLKFRCWGNNLDKNIPYQKKKSLPYTAQDQGIATSQFFKKLIIHMPRFILSKFARPREIPVSKWLMVKVGGWVWAGGLRSEGCPGLSEAVGDLGVSPAPMVLIFQDVSLRRSLSFKDTVNKQWARFPVKGLPSGWWGHGQLVFIVWQERRSDGSFRAPLKGRPLLWCPGSASV